MNLWLRWLQVCAAMDWFMAGWNFSGERYGWMALFMFLGSLLVMCAEIGAIKTAIVKHEVEQFGGPAMKTKPIVGSKVVSEKGAAIETKTVKLSKSVVARLSTTVKQLDPSPAGPEQRSQEKWSRLQ